MNFLGIEIGGTKLQMVRADETLAIQLRRKIVVEPVRGAVGIRERIQEALPPLISGQPIQAVGVGFGGPVDWQTGRICRSHQIEGWSEFDLAGWLVQLVGAPVVVENDANVAAFGEARHGAGQGYDPVCYVTLGSGVGGGLIVGGRIYHGATPGEAEIGHLRLDRCGTTVESRCSGWAVDRRIRDLKANAESVLRRLAASAPGGEARHLAAALQERDPAAKRILNEAAEDLAFGLSHVVHLFHPQMIVVGGGLAGIGEPLRHSIERALRGFVMEAFAPGPRVILASLGEDAVPMGAVELARERYR